LRFCLKNVKITIWFYYGIIYAEGNKKVLKRIYYTAISVLIVLLFATAVSAVADHTNTKFQAAGFSDSSILNDVNERTYTKATSASPNVVVERDAGVYSIYIVFDRIPAEWTLVDTSTGKSVTCGDKAFLHEYVDVEEAFGYAPQNVQMMFSAGTSISEIYAFGEGELPSWVQKWEEPLDRADLLLISSHSDDEQLFFAGVLPYYAGELGYDVQVVYAVSHFDTHERPHEQLDGLWTVGVRNYPIISDIPDLYSESFDGAISTYKNQGVSYEDFSGYITECIRRFKPLVVVSHDINGEYGHGTHLVVNRAIRDYLENAEDEQYFSQSADRYGTWMPQKTYFHLYGENKIVMDWDKPLEAFDGKTAFEVTQDGFKCHKSQHWTWFNRWIYGASGSSITKATDIKDYSPCLYGLYQTSVGYDMTGGDFFENVKTYAVLEYEEESLRASEEESRLEAESLEAASRDEESESVAEAEHESDNEILEPQIDNTSNIELIFIGIVVAGMVLSAVIIWFYSKNYGRKR